MDWKLKLIEECSNAAVSEAVLGMVSEIEGRLLVIEGKLGVVREVPVATPEATPMPTPEAVVADVVTV